MYKSGVTLLLILLCAIGIIIVSVLYNSYDRSKIPYDYAVVFDAGSSGSRMYIYQWQAGYSAARGDPLVVTQNTSCKTDDNGLDKIKSKQDLINKYSNCVKKAQETIPTDRKNRTYLFLAATAGMRLLEVRNKTLADEIFGYVREYFRGLDFLFKNDSQARIISGQEEGTNAWISANYFENNFDTRLSTFNSNKPYTKGILDLGGASTQIVYVPEKINPKYPEFFSSIRIYGINYKPYSHSFLCWGINEITLLYQSYLINKNNYQNQMESACFPSGSKVKLTSSQIINSPCATGLVFNNKYNFTVNSSRINPFETYVYQGKSNKTQCLSELSLLLPDYKCSFDNNECSFDDVYQPTIIDSDFLAFSNYYYALGNTAKLLNLEVDNLDLEKFKNSTSFICSKTLEELNSLNKKNNASISEKFLINQCFSNVFILTLISRYGFTNFDNFKSTDKVNGYSLNWALGYLINELNRDDFLPSEVPPRKLKFTYFLTITILISILIVLLFAYFVHNKLRYHRLKTTNHESIPFGRKRNTQADI